MTNRKPAKTAVVAFKVEKELAEILNELPNKSAFIRKAIVAQLDMVCPLCVGAGLLPKAAHDYFAPLVKQFQNKSCDHCGEVTSVVPDEPAELQPEDRARLEQFFHGGPLYCHPCYVKAATCESCGWHIAPEKVREHKHIHAKT